MKKKVTTIAAVAKADVLMHLHLCSRNYIVNTQINAELY